MFLKLYIFIFLGRRNIKKDISYKDILMANLINKKNYQSPIYKIFKKARQK